MMLAKKHLARFRRSNAMPNLMPNLMIIAIMATFIGTVSIGWSAPAQGQDVSEAFSGLSASSRDPIQIEADSLEVQDRDKTAVFAGNVRLVQGPTTMNASRITVYYAGSAGGSNQQINKVEAQGPIRVRSRDQTARGNRATFTMATQILTLTGNVVLTKGGNELRGDRLVVNLKTGESRIEAPRQSSGQGGNGRVRGVFQPGSN